MNSLEAISKINVKSSTVEKTIDYLREVGKRGAEGMVLWVGNAIRQLFEVEEAIIPIQSGLVTRDGLLVKVEADELFRINKWLYEHKMLAIAQLHSHSGEAYHSDTDNAYPIITTLGGLSLVVPDFASREFELSNCAVYRLGENGWLLLNKRFVDSLIEVIS